MNDTPPEIEDRVRARLMKRSGAERFRMGTEMFEAARRMAMASMPADLPQQELRRRLYQRVYGQALPSS